MWRSTWDSEAVDVEFLWEHRRGGEKVGSEDLPETKKNWDLSGEMNTLCKVTSHKYDGFRFTACSGLRKEEPDNMWWWESGVPGTVCLLLTKVNNKSLLYHLKVDIMKIWIMYCICKVFKNNVTKCFTWFNQDKHISGCYANDSREIMNLF